MQWYIVLYATEWGDNTWQHFKCEGDPVVYWRTRIFRDGHEVYAIHKLGDKVY
jgi:hypothetical protein